MEKFHLKRNIQSLPKSLRRQLAPRPGHIEPGLPLRTKLVRVRVDKACLWSVCKSTSLAIVLILIGATMAAIGFYARELSSYNVITADNTTSSTINANAQWHLKNLTYVGPAFMGLGCVIIVAICVMTFEARDKAAKICPEDPPKPVKDELYVNVIKTIVRKYSVLPKVSVHAEEETCEAAKLLPPPPGKDRSRTSHLLQDPADNLLNTRSVSEPCFPASFLLDNTQLPLMQIGPLLSTPTSGLLLAPDSVLDSSPQPEANSHTPAGPVGVDSRLLQQEKESTRTDGIDSSNNLSQIAAKSSGNWSVRRDPTAGETVVDVHPRPMSRVDFQFPQQLDSPCASPPALGGEAI